MKSNRQVITFLVKAAGLFVLWQVVYYSWLTTGTNLEMWLTSNTTAVSTQVLRWLGFAADYIDHPGATGKQSYSLITMEGKPMLSIADSCNALTLIVLFAGFIIAYPGQWLYKVLFIAVGSIIIFLINVIRSLTLIFNFMYSQSTFDFNHKYTFTIAVYLCVFYFWMLWANRYSKKKLQLVSQ